ncbi:MAG: T9SS type A sorting domain-containing protein [Cytophagales bacterium]
MNYINKLFLVIAFLMCEIAHAQSFWQKKVAVTEQADGSIVSTSSASYASSAYSIDSIPGTQNGYFEFTVNNLYGMVGLTSDPVGGGYATIDYCFQLWASTTLNIMENSKTVWTGTAGSWSKGDVLKITKTDNVIRYFKNNVLLYTSSVLANPSSNYFADFAFGGANTGFDKPVIVPGRTTPVVTKSFWQKKVEVTEQANGSIVSTSSASYASSAYSIDSIPGTQNGYFEFTVNNLYGMVGLTSDPVGGGYATIDYCFQLWASTTLNIMENSKTVWTGTAGSWSKGDVLKITKTDNVIRYYKNNVLLYTSSLLTSPSSNYFADFAFGGANTGFDKPVLSTNTIITDINDSELSNESLIYPNPTNHSFNIANDYEGTVEIVNVSGEIVKTINKKKGNLSENLNLSSGVYLVNFINNYGKRSSKLIVE